MAKQSKRSVTVRDMAIFSMLAALMFGSKVIMDALPNIHLLGMFIMVYTLVYRVRALIPIYLFIFMTGLYGGFGLWWLPYLYIWAILWGVTMLLPRRMPRGLAALVYPTVCCLFGLLYGVLYAPAQALIFGLDFNGMLAWIAAGLPFDLMHGIGNLFAGLLILPLSELLLKLERKQNL
jgi:energy-coupling factor transport system substrate-specific component